MYYKFKNSISACLALAFVLTILSFTHAQDKSRVYMSMDYQQSANPGKLITIDLKTRQDRMFKPLSGIPVKIMMETPDGDSLLANIESNSEGKAHLSIREGYKMVKNEEGYYKIKALYNGDENFKEADKTIEAKDLVLDADFFIEDSVKKIVVNAHEINKNGKKTTPGEVDLEIYVDRIFEDLKVKEAEIQDGKCQITFPNDIPGDSEGNINLRLMVDDRPYHLVELNKTVSWGVPMKQEKSIEKTSVTTLSYILFMVVSIILITVMVALLNKKVSKS